MLNKTLKDMKNWNDIPQSQIEDSSTNIIKLKDGTYKYNWNKYKDIIDAIVADYRINTTLENLYHSISLVYPDKNDHQKIANICLKKFEDIEF